MKLGFSKKSIPVLVMLAGILVLVAVYAMLYYPYQDKISQLQAENDKIQQEVNDLQDKVSQKSFYESETTKMQTGVDKIYALFPAGVEEEDAIMEALTLEQLGPMEGSGIAYQAAAAIYTLGQGSADAATAAADTSTEEESSDRTDTTTEQDVAAAQNGETTEYSDMQSPDIQFSTGVLPAGYQGDYGPITLNDNVITYTIETSYDGIKRIFDYFTSSPDREAIQSVTLGFDEEKGLLTGNVIVNEYSLTGTGKVYEYPELPAVDMGSVNIFGTAKVTGGTEASKTSESSETSDSEKKTASENSAKSTKATAKKTDKSNE